ncbi:coniferyl aldehyde dehydrogenase [Thalassotalea litorea]|uniref:coniferyl aldehyde dehydrogenase n=1 Tax=Thalassotalea litorea TaxID=2020715 RepID=UPI003736F551
MSSSISDLSELSHTLEQQKIAFTNNPYPKYQQRITELTALKSLILSNQQEIITAISADFGHRSADDTLIGDILTSVSAINYTIKHLRKWMQPQKRHVGVLFQPASAKVLYQPLGCIGIIAPWNYPLLLSLGPLITALAAGNRVMIKMSEYTPNTNALLAQLLGQIFTIEQVAVVEGDATMAAAFSGLRFDHILFTGSTQVGRLVAQSAAENLVPVTLELGGKSPAIIDHEIDIKTAVERLILGKTLNAGQTCVAPDYLYCPSEKIEQLVTTFKSQFKSMYPSICANEDYTSVAFDKHYANLQALLQDAKDKGAIVIPLQMVEQSTGHRKMPLTLVLNTNDSMAIMQQEIFGPLLPIKAYHALEDVLAEINQKPRPLALYLYSFNKKTQQQVLRHTHSGGVCINDASFHVAMDDLPFGGVGDSGSGRYHGVEGFQTFSNAKAILQRGKLSFSKLLFPPNGTAFHKLVYKLFIR